MDGWMDRSRGGIRPQRGYIWRAVAGPVVGGAGKRGWIAGQGWVQSRSNAGGQRRGDLPRSLAPPPRFSIGLLRRNRHLASPADDSDRPGHAVCAARPLTDHLSSSVCEAYVVVLHASHGPFGATSEERPERQQQ
jgi:hypothetical protein